MEAESDCHLYNSISVYSAFVQTVFWFENFELSLGVLLLDQELVGLPDP